MSDKLTFVFVLSILIGFIPHTRCQTSKYDSEACLIQFMGELRIDSLYYFSNPYAQDPLMSNATYQFAHKYWKKSFKNSALRGFFSTRFDTLFFEKKFFSKYDLFVLSPNSYVMLNVSSVIEDMIFPYIDSIRKTRIEKAFQKPMWEIVSKHFLNEYEYRVCFLKHDLFLEIIVPVPLFNYYFSKHVSTDPPTCLFCHRKDIETLFVKVLIPISE